eukprot:SAG11_NODE_38_length_21705_cov_24.667453_5_plen_90_part_00
MYLCSWILQVVPGTYLLSIGTVEQIAVEHTVFKYFIFKLTHDLHYQYTSTSSTGYQNITPLPNFANLLVVLHLVEVNSADTSHVSVLIL